MFSVVHVFVRLVFHVAGICDVRKRWIPKLCDMFCRKKNKKQQRKWKPLKDNFQGVLWLDVRRLLFEKKHQWRGLSAKLFQVWKDLKRYNSQLASLHPICPPWLWVTNVCECSSSSARWGMNPVTSAVSASVCNPPASVQDEAEPHRALVTVCELTLQLLQ